jgi:hypothetical protein
VSSSEHLDSHDGPALPAAPGDAPGGRSGRRTAWVVGGAVAVLGIVGAGAWAALSFLSSGPQPAEALPASTLAYASIDLDPSGAQKIEALRTLREFPALRDRLGLHATDDVRRLVFEEMQRSGTCPDVDYGRDVEPWLGDRMAVAAVARSGGDPTPVLVLQVSDEDAARTGLAKLVDCLGPDVGTDDGSGSGTSDDGAGSADSAAFAISDGWALIGADQQTVDGVERAAARSTLADDGAYRQWTEAAGDQGIATFYVSPDAGDALAEELGGVESLGGALLDPPATVASASASPAAYTPARAGSGTGLQALKDFGGLGATLRFDDGSLELEVAADAGQYADALAASGSGTDMVRSLPADTVAAAGFGLRDGWFGALVDQMAASSGSTPDQLMADLAKESGLDLPADAETLAGDSLALAVGPDFDPSVFFGPDSAAHVPVGVKVHGDAAGIQRVLGKVRDRMGADADLLASSSAGDVVAVGPSEAYRRQLLGDGRLGDSEVYRNVVRESDRAAGVLFVDFDAAGWLDSLASDDPELATNLKPLQGLGVSTWVDGGVSHAVLRVTTD